MASEYKNNFSYIFIPFALERAEDFDGFCKSVRESGNWEVMDDEIRYLHRYVSEKLKSYSGDRINAYRFRIRREFAQKQGVHFDAPWYTTEPKSFRGEENVRFAFTISDVQLFSFNTSICVLAFQLCFKDSDPYRVAAAEYYLRKITTERISFGDGPKESFVDLSGKLLEQQLEKYCADFFFYAAPNNERANFLTYIDVPKKDSYAQELFFLKWCYHDGFEYDADCCEDGSEDYLASSNIVWGLSASAAACLVCREGQRGDFVEKTFQKNFQKQYLMTYILLLHQKYMMYLFLTKISVGIDGNLVQLENYKRRLYEFETNYMFSHISEVPQYQRFYEKVKKTFALDAMFNDVREPLVQLAQIQSQAAEKKQREYDNRINTALTTLSLLTVVSAVTDATGVTANLGWLIHPLAAKIIQLAALAGVVGMSIFMICRLISLRNKR